LWHRNPQEGRDRAPGSGACAEAFHPEVAITLLFVIFCL
jgi:hypothetical protein